MRTRYENLEKAGDLLDSARHLLCDVSEPDLAIEVHKLMLKVYTASEEAWSDKFAEPDLEEVA